MIPFDLTGWFRRRMLPLVALAAVVMQVSAPTAFYLTRRHELWQQAHAEAARTAMLLHGEIEQRPILWRYNVPKLLERLAGEGMLHGRFLDIRTSQGHIVPLDSAPPPARPIWGRAEVSVGGELSARVWVALDMAPLLRETMQLGIAFFGLSLLLAGVLYLVPVHTVSIAQKRIGTLLGELALTMQEEDRRRIARDLHDGAGQALTAARLRLLALSGQSGDAANITEITKLLDNALSEVRRSVYSLSPPAITELGLHGALQRHCESFASATGLKVFCELTELPPLRPKVETACYRIVQEALANSAKHARARRAWVQLGHDGNDLKLSVYDDGQAPQQPLGEGLGLLGIRERAKLLGGRAEITVDANRSFRVEVTLPLDEAAAPTVD
ncbi:MAG: sensor histidine kinase [Polyangia bacterium]